MRIDHATKRIYIDANRFDSPAQIANGRAICPGCGSVGRVKRLCVPCEADGYQLVFEGVKSKFEFSTLAEIEWEFKGDVDDPNWSWLDQHANFSHREACEFIVHVGDDDLDGEGLSEYARFTVNEMREGGCTEKFVAAYVEAAKRGAMRVLFWG